MKAISNDNNEIKEIFKKTRINLNGSLVGWPIIIILVTGVLLAIGKAQSLGKTESAWIALAFASLSLLLYIYTQATLQDKERYNEPVGNVLYRLIVRVIEVISIAYVAVPAMCKLLENLFGFVIIIPSPYNWLGIVMLAPGLFLLIWTFWAFAVIGKGTPVPYEASQNLITGGPYRYVRNPMVTATHFIMLGTAIILSSYILLILTILSVFSNHQYTVEVEEKEMEFRFGQEYLEYKARVSRWIPRL
jgi:protein-S-isoprenylcysteine O-methyltransferase Ste14